MRGYNSQRQGTARTLPKLIVLFCVLFVCKCVLYYCHWVSTQFIHSFHWHVQNATIPCRSQELLAFLSVMYFFLPPFSTNYSSILSHLILQSIFLGLPLNLAVPKFIYNTLLGILFSSILCTCPNQRNLFNPIAVTKYIFKKKRYKNHSLTFSEAVARRVPCRLRAMQLSAASCATMSRGALSVLARSTTWTCPIFRPGKASKELLLFGHKTHKPTTQM